MRKQDIKPGVVYAYQRGRGDWSEPTPIVFLNTPADGQLYNETSRHRPPGSPAFVAAHKGAKPHSVTFGSDTGYPAARLRSDSDVDPAVLLDVTLADFEASTSGSLENVKFLIVTGLGTIAGPWEEVVIARESRRRAEDERRERERRKADATRARAINVLTALRAHGITPNRIASYGTVDSVTLPLDEAEKLLALLAAKTETTEEG